MKDDEFDKMLKKAAKQYFSTEYESDDRWDRFAAGEIDDDELAAILDSAADDEQKTAALEAFRPFGESQVANLVSDVRRQLASHDESADVSEIKQFGFNRKKHVKKTWIALGGLAAAAIVLAFLVHLSGSERLPMYAMEVSGQIQEFRGKTSVNQKKNPDTYTVGSIVSVLLTPETGTSSKVDALVLMKAEVGYRVLPFEVKASDEGAVSLSYAIDDKTILAKGRNELLIFIGPREELLAIELAAQKSAFFDAERASDLPSFKTQIYFVSEQ